MDSYRKEFYNNFKPIKGVINVNQIITPSDEKNLVGTILKDQSKFHALRNKIAVSPITPKGLVELSKEGK